MRVNAPREGNISFRRWFRTNNFSWLQSQWSSNVSVLSTVTPKCFGFGVCFSLVPFQVIFISVCAFIFEVEETSLRCGWIWPETFISVVFQLFERFPGRLFHSDYVCFLASYSTVTCIDETNVPGGTVWSFMNTLNKIGTKTVPWGTAFFCSHHLFFNVQFHVKTFRNVISNSHHFVVIREREEFLKIDGAKWCAEFYENSNNKNLFSSKPSSMNCVSFGIWLVVDLPVLRLVCS